MEARCLITDVLEQVAKEMDPILQKAKDAELRRQAEEKKRDILLD